MRKFIRFRATSAVLAILVVGCASSGRSVPDLSGDGVDVIIEAALADAAVPGPLMLDSISFGRLGTLIGDAPFTAAGMDSRVRRDVVMVDPENVLECPSRRPCRLRDGGTYVTLWDAALDGDVLSVTVSRVRNVERLYTMTEHETRLLQLRRTGTGWRLIAREPII